MIVPPFVRRSRRPRFTVATCIALVSMVLGAPPARAAGGQLDVTFGGDGIAQAPALVGQGQSIAVDPVGKIIVAGWTGYQGADGGFAIARFLSHGGLDPTFSGDGQASFSFGAGVANAYGVALQQDGKIVVAGCHRCSWEAGSDLLLARVLPDGSLDPSFGIGGWVRRDFYPGAISVVAGVGVQRDGRIVVGGWVSNPFASFALARFWPNGQRDTSFGFDGVMVNNPGAAVLAFDMVLQSDDRIVLAGDKENEGTGDAVVARYGRNGKPDLTFGTDGFAALQFASSYRATEAVAVTPSGQVVVAGGGQGRSDADFALARFTAAGKRDATFGDLGVVKTDLGSPDFPRYDFAEAIAVQGDGKIVAMGHSYGGFGAGYRNEIAAVRYLPTGSVDPPFGAGGVVFIPGSKAGDATIQNDGKIVAAATIGGSLAALRLLP